MMNIVVDIGNTRTKVGVFDAGVKVATYYDPTLVVWKELLEQPIDHVMVSSVGQEVEEWRTMISSRIPIQYFDRSLKLPLSLHYETPETLGLDRIAAAIGGGCLFSETDLLIIDAGSCITIDLVSKDNVFHGGVISPGVQMRFKAMHAFTDKLPLIHWNVSDQEKLSLPGISTHQCLHRGVLKGIQFEVQGYIAHYLKEHPDLKVILTGGDAQYFENIINTPIFTEDSLVLLGLNRVLEYNVE
jgi:type III pantothenate kinase